MSYESACSNSTQQIKYFSFLILTTYPIPEVLLSLFLKHIHVADTPLHSRPLLRFS